MSNDALGEELAKLINSLPQEKVDKIVNQLSQESCDLNSIFAEGEPGHEEFKKFLDIHSMSFLGGGNSKNFKVTNTDTGDVCVMKMDFRRGNPIEVLDRLKDELRGTLVETYAHVSSTDPDGRKVLLAITEYCPGKNLAYHASKTSDSQRLKQAALIYQQMAKTLNIISKHGLIHSDSKNSNWIFDGTLRFVDTKAVVETEDGFILQEKLIISGGRMFISPRYLPTELIYKSVPDDARPIAYRGRDDLPDYATGNSEEVHAYILGRNIYHFITNCETELRALDKQIDVLVEEFQKLPETGAEQRIEEIKNEVARLDAEMQSKDVMLNKLVFDDEDFADALFTGHPGAQFKSLIQDLVKEDPSHRISVAAAQQRLEAIQQQVQLHSEINELLQAIQSQEAGKEGMTAYLESQMAVLEEHQTNIPALETLKEEITADVAQLNSCDFTELEQRKASATKDKTRDYRKEVGKVRNTDISSGLDRDRGYGR